MVPCLANCVMALVSELVRNCSTMLCDPQPTNSLPVSFGAGMCTGTLFSLLGSSLEGAALEDEPFDERSNLKLDPASPRSARRASPFSAFRLRVVSRSKLEISLLFGSISSALSRIWIASSHLRRFDSAAPFRKYPFAQSGFSSMAFSASLIAFGFVAFDAESERMVS